MSESESDNGTDLRSLALTPTWSVATVLTVFVAVSLLVERSIHRLSNWLKKTDRKPLLAAVEKMKEELMLLGFISLLLTATSSIISNICIPSKFYDGVFARAQRRKSLRKGKMKTRAAPQIHFCHGSYTYILQLLDNVTGDSKEITRALTMRRQSTFVRVHTSNPMHRNGFLVWVTCFFRQFGRSVVRADYLTLRQGFITNHNLTSKYDFHSYMIRSMEEEFQRIVGVSAPLWGFVVAFMLFNIKGSNLYFWIALIPVTLVLLVGAKLQHVIATLALESAGISGSFSGPKFRPRDELFWFNKPELLLSLIHFILFQNAFELASFFWFVGQFLCSYSTLPLYALVTQMGTNYKAALIPKRIRETIHGWGKAARRKRRLGIFPDDSTIHTDASTVISVEEDDDNHLIDSPRFGPQSDGQIELQPINIGFSGQSPVANETSSRIGLIAAQILMDYEIDSDVNGEVVGCSTNFEERTDDDGAIIGSSADVVLQQGLDVKVDDDSSERELFGLDELQDVNCSAPSDEPFVGQEFESEAKHMHSITHMQQGLVLSSVSASFLDQGVMDLPLVGHLFAIKRVSECLTKREDLSERWNPKSNEVLDIDIFSLCSDGMETRRGLLNAVGWRKFL
ncbi:hypothetical protein DH2020_033496 [Rehmannia glutinosa]|uniref:MLO-like protein n=1 Tax=Rehmannia glutinosa TaxID=99300 RepID=A0ABR0VDZ3_REHGL